MRMQVNLGENSYPIEIQNGLLGEVREKIKEVFPKGKVMLVSDDSVFPLYGEKIIKQLEESYECHTAVIPHGEASKSFHMLPKLYEAMLDAKLSRSDLVIALGGGVTGDLTGFAAATYLRGIKYVQIPTSLLAQVDSSVGGKTAVDLPQGKNLIGAFYHPRLVLIDPEVLNTLPKRYLTDGMGEVIKYGCIKDKELFAALEKADSFQGLKPQMHKIIERCVDIKRRVVEEDQFDTGERMLLNFGHTLAHTIEQYFHYSRESHGEAVAVGMYQITKLAEEKGLTEIGCADRIRKLLLQYELPYRCGVPAGELTGAIELDKKNLNQHLNVVLLHRIGDSYVYPASSAFFSEAGEI